MSEIDAAPAASGRAGPGKVRGNSALSDPEDWVDLHGDYLFRYALIRVRNESAAEDLVQETFLAAFKARDRYDTHSTERGWLTGILKHKTYDLFRRQNREKVDAGEEPWPTELDDRFDDLGVWKNQPESGPADWGNDVSQLIQRKEFMAALGECLSRLPARSADAFVLREMEAVGSDKIQEILGVTPSNFWVLLHRARMQLRLCLERNWLHL